MTSTTLSKILTYTVLDHNGQVVAQKFPGRSFHAASTLKLAVLLAAMLKVDAGEVALDDLLMVRNIFQSRCPGAGEFTFNLEETDYALPPVGSFISLREALERMICDSSNPITNMVVNLIGRKSVNTALRPVCDTKVSVFNRLIGDEAARDYGYGLQTSAADLASIMQTVISGKVTSDASTAFMVELLSKQQHPVIGLVQDAETAWGSKSGWDEGIHHDVAFVGTPGQPGSYVLAVCTQGFAPDDAVEAIKEIGVNVPGMSSADD